MKSTGMVRKVDELGRVVIPIELRRNLDINVKDALEIFVHGDQIVMQKFETSCIFCNSTEQVGSFKGKLVCADCLKELKNASGDDS